MDNVNIRKLVESDYDQVIELYTELDEFHVQARPDCFVHREKDKIYPKDAFIHNLFYPGGLELGVFGGDLLVGIVRATLWEESIMRNDLKTVFWMTSLFCPPTAAEESLRNSLQRWNPGPKSKALSVRICIPEISTRVQSLCMKPWEQRPSGMNLRKK